MEPGVVEGVIFEFDVIFVVFELERWVFGCSLALPCTVVSLPHEQLACRHCRHAYV